MSCSYLWDETQVNESEMRPCVSWGEGQLGFAIANTIVGSKALLKY